MAGAGPTNSSPVAGYQSLVVTSEGGYIWVGYPGGYISLAGGQTGGTATVSSTQQASLCFLNLNVFINDGGSTIKRLNTSTLTMVPYVADAGSPPTFCNLNCNWRGRLVIAGDINNQQNFYMSRLGDPYDWNYAATDEAAAVAGNLSLAGQIGEPINSLIPFSDDYLLIGCTNSMWMWQGDPAAGGTLVEVSNKFGMFSANSWVRDPIGQLYFVATGGLYQVNPLWEYYRPPELMSGQNMDEFFQLLSRTNSNVFLQWDINHKYLYIINAGTVSTEDNLHLVYDARNQGLWPQSYAAAGIRPSASCAIEGVTSTTLNTVALGDYNGNYWKYDPSALTDGSSTISTSITFGPWNPFPDHNSIMNCMTLDLGELLQTDPSTAWNASITVIGGPTAADVTEFNTEQNSAVLSTTLDRRQTFIRNRIYGSWFAFNISNTTASTYWSFEKAVIQFRDGGLNRYKR
jgi:hypothetical protein